MVGLKVSALVGGMVAGADSISDVALLRHGAMSRLFCGVRAPSTLGTFLRAFRFGHVRQLDAVAARFLTALTGQAPLISPGADVTFVGIDDAVRSNYGCQAGRRPRILRGEGVECIPGHCVDTSLGAGDRRDPAPEGIGVLRQRCGPVGGRRPCHYQVMRDERDGGAPGGQRVLSTATQN